MKEYIEKLRFFKNNKIITPTPKQVFQNVRIVTGFCLVMGVFVWLTDAAAYGLLDLILNWVG